MQTDTAIDEAQTPPAESRVNITDAGQEYLRELLAKQPETGVAIRVFVTQPGTVHAETCIAYCRPGEEKPDDEIVELKGFKAYFEGRSLPFLIDAKVDY